MHARARALELRVHADNARAKAAAQMMYNKLDSLSPKSDRMRHSKAAATRSIISLVYS